MARRVLRVGRIRVGKLHINQSAMYGKLATSMNAQEQQIHDFTSAPSSSCSKQSPFDCLSLVWLWRPQKLMQTRTRSGPPHSRGSRGDHDDATTSMSLENTNIFRCGKHYTTHVKRTQHKHYSIFPTIFASAFTLQSCRVKM